MAWSPSFDGYDLTATNGVSMVNWSDHGPGKASMVDLLTGGSEARKTSLMGRSITAELQVKGTSQAQLQTRMESLLAVLHQPGFAYLRLDGAREIHAFAQPGKVSPVKGADGIVAKVPVKWVAKDPYWRGITVVSDTDSTATTATLGLTNAGGAPSPFNFQLENVGLSDVAGQTLTVRNTTTGKEFRIYKVDVDAGDVLRIDEDGQVYFEPPIGATSRTPIRIDGAVFDIEPGANTIEITHGMGTDSEFTGFCFSRFHYHGAT